MKIIRAKEDFLWFRSGQIIPESEYKENWANHVQFVDSKADLDVNKDGKIDAQDVKLAQAKVSEVKKEVKKVK